MKMIGSITIIGGGISGIQSALDVANSGFKVYLVEEKPSIGGIMAQLDKTFPTNDCSSCMMGPKLVELANHPDIEIMAYTKLLDLEGEAGNFRLTLNRKSRSVDPERCVGCGICADKCPVKVPNRFNLGLNDRKAIYIPYPQAVPLVYTIDKAHCRYFTKGKCRICQKLCENKAVEFDREDEIVQLNTGAVIMAGGAQPFDSYLKREYGHGVWPNVVTSLEYERILSAAGPFQGHIRRLSDNTAPGRVAWIQCVGSRDKYMGQGYCSYVCCMYATKQAMITREHDRSIDTAIFYLDIRAQGKGFDRFYQRAKSDNGVRYIRSMISRIVPNPADDTLAITYTTPEHHIGEETFDMVVLSVGLTPNPSATRLAQRLGLEMDPYGFCRTDTLDTVVTSVPGIFVSGVLQGPKDIPESVQQGSGAAARATALLSEARGSLISSEAQVAELDISDQQPRIGVFVCHCGINIAGVVDVKEVADYALTLPGVCYATHCMFACSTDQQHEIINAVKVYQLNRIVVASCSPRTHEPLFRDTLREAGLNPYLFELANIREQDSWVHLAESDAATRKAKDLVRMSVSRSRLLKPLYETSYDVLRSALVIGGGLAGLTAAHCMAQQGFESVIVEQSSELGGNAASLHYTDDGAAPACHVRALIRRVENHPLITVYRQSRVASMKGNCGNFRTTLSNGGKPVEVSHGVIIVATGGIEQKPSEYLYGRHPRVATQREFESLVISDPDRVKRLKRVVMIQCVGSREPENQYCSRVCCTAAVKNSLKLKALNPGVSICVLYRDIRTFGLKEDRYLEARRKGVQFFRFERKNKPEVTPRGDILDITVFDTHLQAPVCLEADLLVLSAAIRPRKESKALAEVLRLPLDEDGFFLEAHLKLRPLDFASAGIYLCGLAHGPKFAAEAVTQAHGAVSRAVTVLSKKQMKAEAVITHIDTELCRACGECEKSCVFEAIKVTQAPEGKSRAVVAETLCTGCGGCNVTCPTGAASLAHFSDAQVNVMIRALAP